MPGEDAGVPALTKQEKEKVKRWIEIGAPGDLPPGIEKAVPAPAAAGGTRTSERKKPVRTKTMVVKGN